MMTEVQRLAAFVNNRVFHDLSQEARQAIKVRILDSLGCAISALNAKPIEMLRGYINDFGGKPLVSLIGGGKNAPHHGAFYNSALIRYLDFNDSYLAKCETCHPSDNLGAVLAATEYADGSGQDLITALAIAYQVQCRLSDVAPVRAKGFDHTTQGAYAVAAGVAKALGLSKDQIANAIAISGTCNVALRVTRTGALSHWKGLAYPNTAFIGLHVAFLAKYGITGPLEVFEGDKGFKALTGQFEIDWEVEDLERVNKSILKKYNAEIHSQSSLEGALELQANYGFSGSDIELIEVDIFDVAYNIIGGGEEGDKTIVHTKEEADHSLQYMIAVGLLDGNVLPQQYAPDRIVRDDVQSLLRRVKVRPSIDYTKRFPSEMASHLRISLKNQQAVEIEKRDYEGFYTRAMTWESVSRKFHNLGRDFVDDDHLYKIEAAVDNLENIRVRDLVTLLSDQEKYNV